MIIVIIIIQLSHPNWNKGADVHERVNNYYTQNPSNLGGWGMHARMLPQEI